MLFGRRRGFAFFQPKVFGCTKSYGGSLRLSRLLWLFIVLWPGWRVGEHQFSSPNCPRSFQCGEHFPSSPSFPSNNCLHKKKRAIVKSCQQRTISSTVATKKAKDSSKSWRSLIYSILNQLRCFMAKRSIFGMKKWKKWNWFFIGGKMVRFRIGNLALQTEE